MPKAFLIRGDNILSFHLMGLYGYVWHISNIEADWE